MINDNHEPRKGDGDGNYQVFDSLLKAMHMTGDALKGQLQISLLFGVLPGPYNLQPTGA